MQKVRPEQIDKHCQQPLAGVYIVSGDEPLITQEVCDTLRRAATQQGFTERERHYTDTSPAWAEILAGAANLSLFAERKLLEIHSHKAKLTDEASKALLAYAQEPVDDTLLLLTMPKLDGNAQKAKWFKAFDAAAVHIVVWPVGPDALPRWIDQRLRSAGLKADNEAIDILASKVEGNLLAASQEIDKLTLLSVGKDTLDAKTMAAAVGDSARYDVFTLVDRAVAGDAKAAIRTLAGLLGEGTDAIVILWALTREIRTLAGIHEAIAAGTPPGPAMAQARVWDKRKPLISGALKRVSHRHSQHLLRKAFGIDQAIKGQRQASVEGELQDLVLHLSGAVCLPPRLDLLALS
jgi:DNA polymerase-3 subunit delta